MKILSVVVVPAAATPVALARAQFLVGAKPWLAVKILSVVVVVPAAATPVALARAQFKSSREALACSENPITRCVVLYFRLR